MRGQSPLHNPLPDMTRMLRRLAAACLIVLPLLAAARARADGQPATMPTRDVDITYHLAASKNLPAAEQRVRWEAAAGRQRIDPPASDLHIIVDNHTHHLISVRDKEKLALDIDQSAVQPPPDGPGAYTKLGTATVAGLACTVWQANAAPGTPHLCFTDDGVLLRVVTGGQVIVEAVHVTYAPANPADFEVPADYRRIETRQTSPPASSPGQPQGKTP